MRRSWESAVWGRGALPENVYDGACVQRWVCARCSSVGVAPDCCGEGGTEPEDKALNLPFTQPSPTFMRDRKKENVDTSSWKEFSARLASHHLDISLWMYTKHVQLEGNQEDGRGTTYATWPAIATTWGLWGFSASPCAVTIHISDGKLMSEAFSLRNI